MDVFEKTALCNYTPCIFDSRDEIIEALAAVHAGQERNCKPMEKVFNEVISRTF